VTPLIATSNGHEHATRILLAAGANAYAADEHGRTAIDWARRLGHDGVVKILSAVPRDVISSRTTISEDSNRRAISEASGNRRGLSEASEIGALVSAAPHAQHAWGRPAADPTGRADLMNAQQFRESVRTGRHASRVVSGDV
jgi:ankyrin repeat protein